ncbi:MAG: hypothetical protein R2747_20570 [Pyrinomonadaceae bacterium]
MFYKNFQFNQLVKSIVFAAIFAILWMTGGCAVEAAKNSEPKSKPAVLSARTTNPEMKAKIKIEPNSPADTVRVFYQKMREKKFREALFLTNLRPAIEGLTETELKDLEVDFDVLAGQIPTEIAINGEIIVNNEATVTAKLPDNETNEMKLQEIKLRRENGVWIILTLDEEAEKVVKKEGKNYFFALKVETHQEEAKAMLERIFKAQLVYSAQHDGQYGDVETLISSQFLPEDIRTPESTGYNFVITLSSGKKAYRASAVPADYGKTGKLSFLLQVDENRKSSIKSADNQGKPLKN